MENKTTLLLIVFLLALAGGAVGFYLYQKPTPTAAAFHTDHSISASALFIDYETDEAAANERYLGKTLELTGTIREISIQEETGQATIYLEAGGILGGVSCEMAADQQLAKAKPGEEVTIKGICSGLLMDVVLNRCVIVNA